MKTLKISVICLMVVLPIFLMAQSPIEDLITKYGDKENVTVVSVNAELFTMLKGIEISESGEDQMAEALEELEILQELDGIKLISVDPSEENGNINIFREAFENMPKDYKQLMSIKDGEDEVLFYAKYDTGKVKELLMLIGEHDKDGESVVISITGNIDLKNISKISKQMNIQGMDNLEKLEE